MVDVLLRGGDALWAQLSFRQGQVPETPPTEALVTDLRQLARLSSAPAVAAAASVVVAAPVQAPLAAGQRELEVRIGPLDHPGAANQLQELFEEIPGLGEMRPLDFGQAVDGMRRFSVTTNCTDSELLDLFSFHVDRAQVHLSVLGLGYGFHEGNPGAPSQVAVKAATSAPVAAAVPVSASVVAPAAPRSGGGGAGASVDATTLRVSVDKVDQLINLVGELVITQAMLIQSSRALDPVAHQALLSSISLVERNSRDLQDAVMSIRMIPMSAVFSRFPRMLRDLSGKLGKQVELVTLGEATELDKGLVEKITDPLTHLVRNSCDHGIELPQVRTQNGKPAHGTITLSAWHQGGSVVIEVRDDGKGLSREKLLSKARERGLAAPDSLTDTQVWNLIFEPGFSTADVVTDVSGRGVGMDVVKKNITGLGGRVEIDSAPGCGMSVKVRLPLTLAIMDGMSVAVRDEVYILPMASVVESDLVGPDSIRSLGGGGRVAKVRDDYLPVVDLAELLGSPQTEGQAAPGIMVIVESEGLRAALLVDELVGQQQVVVKNLETHFRRIPDVSGATILGNGKVALILDVGTLVSRR
jgi:two-component system chemotaxis sensor kinase CheA